MVLLDMEMPKSCKDCRINTDGNGRCGLINSSCMYFAGHNTKPVYCPIKAEIPKNVTNGDVMMAVFKEIQYWSDGKISAKWWDAPWKGQEEK